MKERKYIPKTEDQPVNAPKDTEEYAVKTGQMTTDEDKAHRVKLTIISAVSAVVWFIGLKMIAHPVWMDWVLWLPITAAIVIFQMRREGL